MGLGACAATHTERDRHAHTKTHSPGTLGHDASAVADARPCVVPSLTNTLSHARTRTHTGKTAAGCTLRVLLWSILALLSETPLLKETARDLYRGLTYPSTRLFGLMKELECVMALSDPRARLISRGNIMTLTKGLTYSIPWAYATLSSRTTKSSLEISCSQRSALRRLRREALACPQKTSE